MEKEIMDHLIVFPPSKPFQRQKKKSRSNFSHIIFVVLEKRFWVLSNVKISDQKVFLENLPYVRMHGLLH